MSAIRNDALVAAIRAAAATSVFHVLPDGVALKFSAAAARFPIAPDPDIDVGRIPSNITTWNLYLDYLDAIRRELENPREDTKTSGRLKLYKLSVVLIHAIAGWMAAGAGRDMSLSDMTASVISHARANVPSSLSDNGRKLWTYTFATGTGRHASLCSYLLVTASAPDAAAGVGGADSGGGTGADGEGGAEIPGNEPTRNDNDEEKEEEKSGGEEPESTII